MTHNEINCDYLKVNNNELSEQENLEKTKNLEKSSKRIFIFIIYIFLLINFDTGVIPPSINEIKSSLQISYVQTASISKFILLFY